jgi:hypothetical protein
LGHGLPIWDPGCFLSGLFIPLVNGSNQAIWQAKVAPDLQGRVFSARRLIAWFTNPISPIIGGTLSDFVLEPAMKTQSSRILSFLRAFLRVRTRKRHVALDLFLRHLHSCWSALQDISCEPSAMRKRFFRITMHCPPLNMRSHKYKSMQRTPLRIEAFFILCLLPLEQQWSDPVFQPAKG